MTTTARLVVADDHPIVLDGLLRLFEAEPGIDVVAACKDGEATVRAVREHEPDLLMLDLRMPGLSGLDVLRHLADQRVTVRTVLLTAYLDEEDLIEAVRLGIRGLVLKDMAPNLLVRCVRAVCAGEQWFESQIAGRALERVIMRDAVYRDLLETLTPREIEIARLVARSLRNKEIAARLGITEGTVKIHLHHVYDRLNVTSRLQLANKIRDAGLVQGSI